MRWFEHMPDKRAGLIEKGMEIMTAGNSAKAVGKIPHYTLTISIKRKKRYIRKDVFNTSSQNDENLIALLLTGNYRVTNANLLKLMYSENAPCISTMGSCLLSKTRGKSSIFFWKVVSWSRHPFISMKSCYRLLASCNQVPLFIASFTRAFANNLWRTISGRRKDTMWVQILIEKEKKKAAICQGTPTNASIQIEKGRISSLSTMYRCN